MPLDRQRCRPLLREFRFRDLFVEELGWDRHAQTIEVPLDGQTYTLAAIAEKRGMVAFECPAGDPGIPDYPTRRKIQTKVARSVHEHLIVYVDEGRTEQIWQWVKREPGRPRQCREHRYHHTQPGDSLLQKLEVIAFALDEEAELTLVEVTGRVRAAFDVDRVTRRFYDRFKAEHAAFLGFLKGIPDEDMQRWYVSVMLNRLMFIYFIQKRGFLDGDPNYLANKLAESKRRGSNRFYRDFLCPLFFEGFAKREKDRSQEARRLLGGIPYLNGGIFMPHEIEQAHGQTIQIADAAFGQLFAFFDAYQWHLDERPLRRDDEINPDVLGYIFEKYINQKQMGAYYTKEDITGYISQNTVIPYLFAVARQKCRIAFEGESSVWRLLQDDPDRYLYPALRSGVIGGNGEVIPESALPDFVQVGMRDPKARMFDRRYNLGEAFVPDAEGNNLAVPTETWREYVCRRQRCLELRAKLAAGEITETNDLITYNLDIRQFAQDVIEECEGPELLRAFWHAIESVTVLDPTCGSGAFLFAALNILEPLYEACLQRMEAFVEDLARSGERHSPRKFEDFRKVLARVEQHPNHRYFILKSVVINNLFGVDIMEEAVEICKLRLFLKLVAQIESLEHLEPLPDIDFNIRAGNTLVGYARLEDIRRGQRTLDFEDVLVQVELKAAEVGELFALFRQQQTELGGEVTAADKDALRAALKPLEDELNRYLAGEYGVDLRRKKGFEDWRKSHKPFHWFVEFYGIMKRGGFDVIIGNPPWREYAQVRQEYRVLNYATEGCGNLHAICTERALGLRGRGGRASFIVQLPLTNSSRMTPARALLTSKSQSLFIMPFDDRPGKLFEGLQNCRATIFISQSPDGGPGCVGAFGRYQRWYSEWREWLFPQMEYVSPAGDGLMPGLFPKLGSRISAWVLARLARPPGTRVAANMSRRETEHALFYQEATRYWVKAAVGLPYYSKNGVEGAPAHGRFLYLRSEAQASALFAVLHSSLFYLYFITYGDCFHLSDTLVSNFPADGSVLGDPNLSKLGRELMDDLREHSTRETIRTFDGNEITYEEFYGWQSKPIIDRIDQVLAKHYGFTDEELDFIINYDIKYRMGREADSGGEE